jgi:chromate transporter
VVDFVEGVTAAATGAIAGAALILAQRAITDVTTGLIAIATLGLRFQFRKLPDPAVIAVAGAAGLLLG